MSSINNLVSKIDSIGADTTQKNIGIITNVKDGVVLANGLGDAGYNEIVQIESGDQMIPGVVFNLEEDQVGILILSNEVSISAGAKVYATGNTLSIPVGDEILGHTVDALGVSIDGSSINYTTPKEMLIEKKAYGVMSRKSVSRPLKTGITVIDALVNVGRGQ